MSYDQNTPRPTETPAQSQPLMAGNFLQIATSYNTDHIPLTSGVNVGYSNKLTLVSQGSDPAKVVATGTAYSKTISTHPELFYEGGTEANSQILQVTNQLLTTASGQGMLPGGLQIRAGSGTASSGAGTTNTFNLTFPTGCIAVVANTIFGNNSVGIGNITASTFVASTGSGSVSIYYIAIGY